MHFLVAANWFILAAVHCQMNLQMHALDASLYMYLENVKAKSWLIAKRHLDMTFEYMYEKFKVGAFVWKSVCNSETALTWESFSLQCL